MQLSLTQLALVCLTGLTLVSDVTGLPTELNRRTPGRVRRNGPRRLNARTENATATLDPLTIQTINATETATVSATATAIEDALLTETASVTDELLAETATFSSEFVQATATSTEFPVATETPFFHGTNPIEQSVFPKIDSWGTCNDFLKSNGINLFPNSFDSFDVFIQQVTVIQILIDDRGRPRRRRTFNHFPPPQDYFPEFDLSIQQNNIIAIDANGFRDGSFDDKIGFDDKFDFKGNGRGNDRGNGRGNGRGKGGGFDKDDINDLIKNIVH